MVKLSLEKQFKFWMRSSFPKLKKLPKKQANKISSFLIAYLMQISKLVT